MHQNKAKCNRKCTKIPLSVGILASFIQGNEPPSRDKTENLV